jgi:Flp pilus assembly protein TadD
MSAAHPPSEPSDPAPEPGVTSEEFRQRALLFADLGRYDEAAGEIASGLTAAPADGALLATLARIHLAADQPAEALVAAERAVAAAPREINPLVVRAMALTDNSRYADAARVATEVLHRWPADPYALRTGAALLSEAHNGQEALNAAWDGVRLAPANAEAHLVLAVVAARLRLFDLAQRAYGEALELDAGIGDAQRDVGIVRLERRRWAQALEDLAGEAPLGAPPDSPEWPEAESPDAVDPADPSAPRSDRPSPWRSRPSGPAARSGPPASASPSTPPSASDPPVSRSGPPLSPEPPSVPIARPAHPVLDPFEDSATALAQAVRYGGNGTLVAAVLTAAMTAASAGASRVWAGMVGILLLIAVPIWLGRRLTEPLSSALGRLRTRDRRRALAVYGALAAPILIVLYAVIGGLPLLVIAMVIAAGAQLLMLVRRS